MRADTVPIIGVSLGHRHEMTAISVLERTYVSTGEIFNAAYYDGPYGRARFELREKVHRVSRITDTRTLSEMLAWAEMVGDAPPVRVVLYRGYELQSETLLGSYLENYPEEQQTWETFMEAVEEHNTLETLGTSALTGVAEPESPQELGHQSAVTPRGAPSGEEA